MNTVKGNLLDLAEAGEFDIIVQGCNCFNAMGGGIAKEIAMRYPNVAEVDAQTIRGDYNKLGNYTMASVVVPNKKPFTVINAYTQYSTSRGPGNDVFEYVAFELILQKLAAKFGEHRFGFPYIGMGLAQGDSEKILWQLRGFDIEVEKQGGSVTLVEFK